MKLLIQIDLSCLWLVSSSGCRDTDSSASKHDPTANGRPEMCGNSITKTLGEYPRRYLTIGIQKRG